MLIVEFFFHGHVNKSSNESFTCTRVSMKGKNATAFEVNNSSSFHLSSESLRFARKIPNNYNTFHTVLYHNVDRNKLIKMGKQFKKINHIHEQYANLMKTRRRATSI